MKKFYCGARKWRYVSLPVAVLAIGMAFPDRIQSQDNGAIVSTQHELLHDFNSPFLFAYGSWDKKVSVANSNAVIQNATNAGGAGHNVSLNLLEKASLLPALRIRTGEGNETTGLRLMLIDTSERSGTWEYSLQGAKLGEWTTLTPRDGQPLSEPNSTGKPNQKPDLSKIIQVQLQGDWAGNKPLNIEVDAVLLLAPDAAALTAREDRQRQQQVEREKLRQQQQELKDKYSTRSQLSPQVAHIAPVAPDVLAVEFISGRLVLGTLKSYAALPGDKTEIRKRSDGKPDSVILVRDNKQVGYLLPTWAEKQTHLKTFERIEGDPLLDFEAENAANYNLSSANDANYSSATKVTIVGRKSEPIEWVRDGDSAYVMRHTFYLKLPKSLTEGKQYSLSLGDINAQKPSAQFTNDSAKLRSEAVHVNQIGYRPDDPAKRAFVSCWMGTGGNLKLPAQLKFSIVNDKTGKAVFSGQGEVTFPANKPELMQHDENFNGADVARLDFSVFKTPGRYRVVVEGVGSSYPFSIGPDVWKTAFITQMRGLFNNRSGMELGPPYTNFKKPRDMHPADGYKVFKSKYRAVESGGEAWEKIGVGNTDEEMPQAYGGYHDAGDWNPRRVTHLKVTMASLEVFDMFPEYFKVVKLGIPPTQGLTSNTPDILAEAAWEFETFRRLQQSDGGIPYGIETGLGDPMPGEVSWLQSFPAYVFTADYLNSWYYAAAGARLSRLLQPYDSKRAALYRQSAIRAFEFAEKDFTKDKATGLTEKRGNTWEAIDFRNLAAVELLHLTRDAKYHTVFLQDTVLTDPKPDLFRWGVHVQREQAFRYARLPRGAGDETLKKKAIIATEEMAQRALNYAANNAFNITTPDKGKPQFIGFYSTPDAFDLTRAHYLTGKSEYLKGAVQATQFQSGCNPNNLVYTSGLGANPIKGAFKLDARHTGQSLPEGFTPYGNIDFKRWNGEYITWPITWHIGKVMIPSAYEWPTTEAYWDLGQWPMLEEFTVDIWSPNVQVWGYLAARKAQAP